MRTSLNSEERERKVHCIIRDVRADKVLHSVTCKLREAVLVLGEGELWWLHLLGAKDVQPQPARPVVNIYRQRDLGLGFVVSYTFVLVQTQDVRPSLHETMPG